MNYLESVYFTDKNFAHAHAAEVAEIMGTMHKMSQHLENHDCICVSVSGGADSDAIVHLICTYYRAYLYKIHFVFSNTGVEYRATLQHIKYLEKIYSIKIKEVKGVPIPKAVKENGVPCFSKYASEMISRLQSKGFEFTCQDYNYLSQKYKNCQVALLWFCNKQGENSRFNAKNKKYLDEFMIKNPPDFKISNKCCTLSKKEPMANFEKAVGADLIITGERKSEGGARASAHKSCFEKGKVDKFMPLWWWDDDTKQLFKNTEGYKNSDCYEVYGLKRTGCVGCPYGRKWKDELDIMKIYEPQLYSFCIHVFGKAYEYQQQLEDYKNLKDKGFLQTNLFDL